MDGIGNFISMMDYILDTKRKRHITGGILLSTSLLFGGLALTVMTIQSEEELKGDKIKKNIAENVKAGEQEKTMSIKEYASFLQKQGYTNYSDTNEAENKEETKSVKPYVIPPEQFGEIEEYDQIELTYYADHILADENDDIVEDVEEAIGFESLSHFGEYEDDSVFVRNDERRCDYQILLDQGLYSDIAVHIPHQMEV